MVFFSKAKSEAAFASPGSFEGAFATLRAADRRTLHMAGE